MDSATAERAQALLDQLGVGNVAECHRQAFQASRGHAIDVGIDGDIGLVVRFEHLADHPPDAAEAEDHHLGCIALLERACELLVRTPGPVTAICDETGFASLGSFSSRFHQLVGESPTAYRDRWARRGSQHVPGCYLFMKGAVDPTVAR